MHLAGGNHVRALEQQVGKAEGIDREGGTSQDVFKAVHLRCEGCCISGGTVSEQILKDTVRGVFRWFSDWQ
ncbi:hypothetical protein D3C80_1882210 [compost metagenome]